MDKLKIWHISDTHGFHELLKVPVDIDIVCHSGDASNYKDPYRNANEMLDFIEWYKNLPISCKIYIAGNHDTCIEKRLITKDTFKQNNIIYLENDSINLFGINFYGSPYTPTYGEWSFMKARDKIHKVWDNIPLEVDVLITHGPAKGKLDLSLEYDNSLKLCGCSNLGKKIKQLFNLQYHLFGHVHNCSDIINAGIVKESISDIIYSNGSVVTDGKFGKLSSNGNIFEINLK